MYYSHPFTFLLYKHLFSIYKYVFVVKTYSSQLLISILLCLLATHTILPVVIRRNVGLSFCLQTTLAKPQSQQFSVIQARQRFKDSDINQLCVKLDFWLWNPQTLAQAAIFSLQCDTFKNLWLNLLIARQCPVWNEFSFLTRIFLLSPSHCIHHVCYGEKYPNKISLLDLQMRIHLTEAHCKNSIHLQEAVLKHGYRLIKNRRIKFDINITLSDT